MGQTKSIACLKYSSSSAPWIVLGGALAAYQLIRPLEEPVERWSATAIAQDKAESLSLLAWFG